ncbi:Thioredoxin, mitochondrial [Amphibalanus amphitrite]|uniref:Thioredoxin, mitochondrial n=1 Tax=Amphibalanus amphitrite TaxID=1232801 RepID=A0A6A4WKM6_AMPAM|nr:thioredoxin, mitochondrial-like [Amphibalanus amphitrite]XP_043200034.1 thioredoxin, mitochondrial-like [Amphibalanus amphitrite]XP_043226396.1 thioredoxin, mitochondrial-like [Amphibalanus amphitrite]XP_043226397.1 thioredoxin, mitochondrial-like [Amphibalanus amphitrite]KAF0307425.1 Thioredoxin, mitochondrial [Amphibalanus amphitrite]
MASRLLFACYRMGGRAMTAGPARPTLAVAAARQFHGSAQRLALLQISDREDFHERVILSPIPVIVNFHADWCEPCKDLTPMLERLVKPKRNLNLCSLDIENHVDLLQDFEVQAVPAVLAFFNGQVVEKFVGLVNEQIVTDFVGKVIGRLNAYTDLQAAQKEPRDS